MDTVDAFGDAVREWKAMRYLDPMANTNMKCASTCCLDALDALTHHVEEHHCAQLRWADQ